MNVEYTELIRDEILNYLDGWVVYSQIPTNDTSIATNDESNTEEAEDENIIQPFITDSTEFQNTPNKTITDMELSKFFYSSYNKSLMITNRLNIDDLTENEAKFYIQGVCILTASDVWNKYNIRVNNEDLEDTYIQSYGGLLYKQSMTILKNFINQRVTGLSQIRKIRDNSNNTSWFL